MDWERSEATIEFEDGTKVTSEAEFGSLSERLGQALKAAVKGPMLHVSFGGSIVSIGHVCGSDGRARASKLVMQIAYTREREPGVRIEVYGADWNDRKVVKSVTSSGGKAEPVESDDTTLYGNGGAPLATHPVEGSGIRGTLF